MYIADLHIHSRYSRATSKTGDPEHLDFWAARKGISIVGTGDFTHPAWREELREKLTPAEDGLYTLKNEYRLHDRQPEGGITPRFVLTSEISSIYKKNGKTRKVHNLIFLPSLDDAERLSKKLETIGNIHSDGRPILGLDCHDLLEITLELCPRAIYVPAHIWTPHFSLFGAFSGFDTIEECYEDLTPHIHALETGLSSDPTMNRRWSALDRFQLISNSDAHSPAKLGREANLLNIPLSYNGLYDAIQTGNGLEGTIEFFPEEGKYHYDGHRKCNVCLSPSEAEQYNGICPVCGRKLTTGVSHRIAQLADREEGFVHPHAKPFEYLVPLPEIIAASMGYSSASAKVQRQYESMIQTLGAEFHILREVSKDDIRRAAGYLISEGVRRLRERDVKWNPGYDGEYGTMKLFDSSEIDNLHGQGCFLSVEQMVYPAQEKTPVSKISKTTHGSSESENREYKIGEVPRQEQIASALNERQREAVMALDRAVAVIAGPGTGKTKTLVSRIIHLLKERNVKPSEITAVTFTKKAAEEMRTRLENAAGGKRVVNRMRIGTFHSLCYQLLKEQGIQFALADETELFDFAQEILSRFKLKTKPKQFLRMLSLQKTGLNQTEDKSRSDTESAEPKLQAAYEAYADRLAEENIMDYDDLLLQTIRLFEAEGNDKIRKKFSHLLVDEFQDISPLQYELIREWNRDGRELFVIGDPDQAIYSFRGADSRCFERLKTDFSQLHLIHLKDNYRSDASIVSAALHVIAKNEGDERELSPTKKTGRAVRLVTAQGELSEDIFAAKEINRLIGGIDMLDAGDHAENRDEKEARGFGDIAILYRNHSQEERLEECLRQEGIPYIVAGRQDFMTDEAVRGTLCFFRYVRNPNDQTAFRQCLKMLLHLREDAISTEILTALAEAYTPRIKKEKPQKVLARWIREMDLIDNEAMGKLIGMSLFHKTMAEFMDTIDFGVESDLKRCGGKTYEADAVTLMTLHGAKGLEFPVVMICGVRNRMIPLEYQKQTVNLEEERRLFYVGMTRAEEELILVTSSEPSPFLADIPQELIQNERVGKQRKRTGGKQMNLLDAISEKEN